FRKRGEVWRDKLCWIGRRDQDENVVSLHERAHECLRAVTHRLEPGLEAVAFENRGEPPAHRLRCLLHFGGEPKGVERLPARAERAQLAHEGVAWKTAQPGIFEQRALDF